MRALTTSSYGPLERLHVAEVPTPEPGPSQVRVRVEASALNPADYKVVLGTLKFLHARNFPLIVGYDFSGTVEAVGAKATGFAVGAEVFGFLPYSPTNRRGAFAESVVADVGEIALKPAGVSHAIAAAAATPGLTALQMLRDLAHVQGPGKRVLITGASGGVGALAIGIAVRLGATVTAIGSGSGVALAKKLGATHVLDRRAVDVLAAAEGPFDAIIDAAAAYRWSAWRGKLAPGGTYVTTLPSLAWMVDSVKSWFSGTRVKFINVKSRAADLNQLGEWLAAGLEVPIDHIVPVKEVAASLEKLRSGATLGRIGVAVAGGF